MLKKIVIIGCVLLCGGVQGQKRAKPDVKNQITLLRHAITSDDINKLKYLVEEQGFALNSSSTFLLDAIDKKNAPIVQYLLEKDVRWDKQHPQNVYNKALGVYFFSSPNRQAENKSLAVIEELLKRVSAPATILVPFQGVRGVGERGQEDVARKKENLENLLNQYMTNGNGQ